MPYGVALVCTRATLKNETEVKVCGLRQKSGRTTLTSFKFSWDVNITGKKMRIRIDNFNRFDDKRMLYRGLTEVIVSLMPFIYNLAQESKRQDFEKIRSYPSLREFLGDLKTISSAVLLNDVSNFCELDESILNLKKLQIVFGKEILNLKPEKRLNILIKEWKKYFGQVIDLFTNSQISMIFLEYYIDLNSIYDPDRLEGFKEIMKDVRSYNIIPIISIKGDEDPEKFENLPLDLVVLDSQSLQLYELIVDMAREKNVKNFTLFDIVRYLRGGTANSLNEVTQRSLDLLVDNGLLEKKDNRYHVIL
ncbi:MAG: hypothetical protein KIH08_09935 [Candidatus Freyarchaeota archaeon]|nr:hypothetical protein [Candidatus Jordarchaeia archaeon]MBS7270307.1 hypothetical protein [Candidatus Jordarchaeia archaeon]MBS7281029.1 hypothetical protein [Candidatus Jordarchaeia archaeon]